MTVADEFWAKALRECEGGVRDDALWAKAYVAAAGNEQLAKAGYLQQRALQLSQQAAINAATVEAAAVKVRAEAAERAQPLMEAFRAGRPLTPQELSLLVTRAGEDRTLLRECDRLRGRTLTHLCAMADLCDEVAALLSFGADPSAPDGNGRPPTWSDGTPVSAT